MFRFFALLLASLSFLSGCGSDDNGFVPQAPPAGSLQVFNALPDSPALVVRFEAQQLGTANFRQSTPFTQVIPDISRTLQVNSLGTNAEQAVLATSLAVPLDTFTTAILTGTVANPEVLEINLQQVALGDDGNAAGVRFVHVASNATDRVIFTLSRDDTEFEDITATIQRNQFSQLRAAEAGTDYRLRVLRAGNNEILWDSGAFTIAASSRPTFVLTDSEIATSGVRVSTTATQNTTRFPNEIGNGLVRVGNMIPDRTAVDIYINDELVGEDLLFGDLTDYRATPSGSNTVRITTANDPSDVLSRAPFELNVGQARSTIAVGLDDDTNTLIATENVRRLARNGVLTFSNASLSTGAVDVYMLLPEQTVNSVNPTRQGLNYRISSTLSFPANTFDLVLTEAGTANTVFGPQSITLAPRGLYRLFATDSAGGGTPTDVVLEDDF